MLLTATILRIASNYSKAFDEYSETVVKSYLKIRINRIISENINSLNMQFNEITSFNRDKNGRIISISINSILLNSAILQIEEEILKDLTRSSLTIGMPLGNLFGIKFLSGKGPTLNVSIYPIMSTAQEPKSELISGGINQSLHRITTVFETEVSCLAPFYKTKCNISTTIVISETLIVGEIPEIIISPVD